MEEIKTYAPQDAPGPALIHMHKFGKQWTLVHDALVCQCLLRDGLEACRTGDAPTSERNRFSLSVKFTEDEARRLSNALDDEELWARSFECEPRNR